MTSSRKINIPPRCNDEPLTLKALANACAISKRDGEMPEVLVVGPKLMLKALVLAKQRGMTVAFAKTLDEGDWFVCPRIEWARSRDILTGE